MAALAFIETAEYKAQSLTIENQLIALRTTAQESGEAETAQKAQELLRDLYRAKVVQMEATIPALVAQEGIDVVRTLEEVTTMLKVMRDKFKEAGMPEDVEKISNLLKTLDRPNE